MGKILFLVPYPWGNAPSQRYRFEQYFKILQETGYQIKFAPFIDQNTWDVLYQQGKLFRKASGYVRGIAKRFLLLFTLHQYQWIFIHRESVLLGPPILEWALVSVFKKRIIYDFDDAIWLPATSESNRFLALFKNERKTSIICQLSERVSVGNSFLANYALGFNRQVHVIPTTIDTIRAHNFKKDHRDKKVVIGWTGSHSTLPYLEELIAVFERLERTHQFQLKVIADQEPTFKLNSLTFKKWNLSSEIEDLSEIDIGLMPLPDNEWSLGKCGLKALQYMALGIPALVTPIGANKDIVTHGEEGYHCNSSNEWFDYLVKLMEHPNLRNIMGAKGRKKVIRNYSVEANAPAFLDLFR